MIKVLMFSMKNSSLHSEIILDYFSFDLLLGFICL